MKASSPAPSSPIRKRRLSKASTPPVVPRPDLSLSYQYRRELGGDSGAKLYEASCGAAIVWKPASALMVAAEAGASSLAHYISGGLVPVALPMTDPGGSEEGLAQTFVTMSPLTLKGNIASKKVDLSGFSADQIAELFVHAMADWICSNWDTHSGNFGIADHDQVVAIDKGQAFKYFREGLLKSPVRGFMEPNTLDLTAFIRPRRPNVPVYPALADYLQKNQGSAPNANHDLISAALSRCDDLRSELVEDCLADYAALAFKSKESQFYGAVVARAKRARSAAGACVGQVTKAKRVVITPSTSPSRPAPKVTPPLMAAKPQSKIVFSPSKPPPRKVPQSVVVVPKKVGAHPLLAESKHERAFLQKLEMLGGVDAYLENVAEVVASNEQDHQLSAPPEYATLTDCEKIAVWNYTRQYFRYWNSALRNAKGDPKHKDVRRHEAGIRVCTSGLSKLPIDGRATHRVESSYKARHNGAVVGATIDWWSFSSSGYNLDYLQKSEFAGGVEWHIRSGHQGRQVDFLSQYPQEGEILFLPGTTMKVVARSGNPQRREIVIIELEQV